MTKFIRSFGMRRQIYDIIGDLEKTEKIYQLFRKAFKAHKTTIRYQRAEIRKMRSEEAIYKVD